MSVLAWVLGSLVLTAQATTGQAGGRDLRTLTLEDLMTIPVSTVARQPVERLRSPASVFVITAEDIRRSGATTVAEVLRLAPGVHVAQIDGNKWAIGIRGFADRLSRAMLVLVDGRAVYSPLFAGTYWEVQDLPLSDIQQIEVVRGPGGALWGANAVTGIINIIRKPAAATVGTVLTIQSGPEDPVAVAMSYGRSLVSGLQYRLSGKVAARDPQISPLVRPYDDATIFQAGARLDWQRAAGEMTLQGDVYRMEIGQRDALVTYDPPAATTLVTSDPLSGGNVLFRWDAAAAAGPSRRLQLYYDYSARDELAFGERQHTADADYQEGRRAGRHSLLWGAGYRLIAGRTDTRGTLAFTPPNRTDQLFSAFAQDEVEIAPSRASATVGVKVEHNAFSGVEWQPSARLLWTPTPAYAISASVARAVRTPSRVEHDFESGNLLNPQGPTFVRLQPNPEFEPEALVAYEAGIVALPHPKVLATLSLFRNQHDRVFSTELLDAFVESDGTGRRVIVPVMFANGLRGHSYGLEATADLRPASEWRVTASYSALRILLTRRPGGEDLTQERRAEEGSPRHQVQVTTSFASGRAAVDWFLRYVSSLPALGVPDYATSNVRFEWRLRDSLRLFLVGKNLHAARHAEFADGANGILRIQRTALVGVRWSR
jgi:iron complex outermembrane receptor protein